MLTRVILFEAHISINLIITLIKNDHFKIFYYFIFIYLDNRMEYQYRVNTTISIWKLHHVNSLLCMYEVARGWIAMMLITSHVSDYSVLLWINSVTCNIISLSTYCPRKYPAHALKTFCNIYTAQNDRYNKNDD